MIFKKWQNALKYESQLPKIEVNGISIIKILPIKS